MQSNASNESGLTNRDSRLDAFFQSGQTPSENGILYIQQLYNMLPTKNRMTKTRYNQFCILKIPLARTLTTPPATADSGYTIPNYTYCKADPPLSFSVFFFLSLLSDSQS